MGLPRQAEFDRVRQAIREAADPEPFYFVPHQVGRRHYFYNQHDDRFYPVTMPVLRHWLRRAVNGVCGSDVMRLDGILRGIATTANAERAVAN